MDNSLRSEVEALAAAWRQTAEQMTSFGSSGADPARRLVVCANELESAIARYPHAGDVVVPRDLLLRIGVKIAKYLPKTHPMTYDDDLSALLKLLYVTAADIAPADVILSVPEGKA